MSHTPSHPPLISPQLAIVLGGTPTSRPSPGTLLLLLLLLLLLAGAAPAGEV
jgi:hypothetical protein